MKISKHKLNDTRFYKVKLSFYYYVFFVALIMFLLMSIIPTSIFNSSFAQTLSDSISLKANAGEDQYVEEGQPVILNAENSVSSDPPIDLYQWLQAEPNYPLIDLENGDSQKTSFIAPNLPREQYFVFQLIVQDNNVTDTDTVNVYVVEDLSSITKSGDGGLPASYQPEICYDGTDNDFDGEIDLQDEDCGMRLMQDGSSQLPLEGGQVGPTPNDQYLGGQTGTLPFDPNYDPYFDNEQGGGQSQQGQLPQGPTIQPNPSQPNSGQPNAGQSGQSGQ
jgi:hypothetical protein